MKLANHQISKKLLRHVFLDYRRLLDQKIYDERNFKLSNNLLAYLDGKGFKMIHVFLPLRKNKEPDLLQVLPELRKLKYEIVTSKTDFKNKILEHFILEPNTKIEENKLGIPEPQSAIPVTFEKIDIVLVPLAVADKIGNRIGYGGGFYDKLLANSNVKKVGLCLSPLLDKIKQMEPLDQSLDHVLTPFD